MIGKVYLGSAAILALGSLAACGQPDTSETRESELEDYAAQHGIDADITVDDNGDVSSVTMNSAGGGQVGTDLPLPPGFPDDVVLHSSEAVYSVTPSPGGIFMVQAFSDATIEDLSAWHRSEMQQRGWTEQGGSGSGPLSFRKDGRLANINFIPNGGRVTVQIMTMPMPG